MDETKFQQILGSVANCTPEQRFQLAKILTRKVEDDSSKMELCRSMDVTPVFYAFPKRVNGTVVRKNGRTVMENKVVKVESALISTVMSVGKAEDRLSQVWAGIGDLRLKLSAKDLAKINPTDLKESGAIKDANDALHSIIRTLSDFQKSNATTYGRRKARRPKGQNVPQKSDSKQSKEKSVKGQSTPQKDEQPKKQRKEATPDQVEKAREFLKAHGKRVPGNTKPETIIAKAEKLEAELAKEKAA